MHDNFIHSFIHITINCLKSRGTPNSDSVETRNSAAQRLDCLVDGQYCRVKHWKYINKSNDFFYTQKVSENTVIDTLHKM